MRHSEATLEVFHTSYRFTDGLLHPGETPGLGVELDDDAAAGWLLDGYPRTAGQVAALDDELTKTGQGIDAVISLVADTEILVARLLKRAELEGRADDNADTIRNRMVIYTEATDPLLATYRDRGLLVEVDGIGGIDEVAGRITSALDAKLG